jgi:anti-repressor protein
VNELVQSENIGRPFPVDARTLHERLGAGRDFSNWIKERIQRFQFMENLDYRISSKSGENQSTFDSPNPANQTGRGGDRRSIEYSLTVPAAKMIAAVENSEAGRKVLAYLVKVEEAWNTPEMVLVRAQQAAQEIINRQKQEIALLESDAKVARVIAHAYGRKTVTELAKINGVGPRKMFELLCVKGIIYRRNGAWLPMQQYIDSGYFVVKEAPYGSEENEHLYSQIYVTGKGEVWLAKQLFKTSGPDVYAQAVSTISKELKEIHS